MKTNVFSYICFVIGLSKSEEWITFHRYYKRKQLNEQFSDVSPLLRSVLLSLPFVALPTILLLVLESLLYGSIVFYAEKAVLSTLQAVILITFIMFTIFSPGHDAAHGSVSSNTVINGIVGRISFTLMGPIAVFSGWRALHLRHHKFTNDPEKDPDKYACHGPTMLLPLRWLTTIPQYCVYWLCLTDEPGALTLWEKIETTLNLSVNFSVCVVFYDLGYFYQIYFYWILPSFFCHGLLVFAFDFLPHFRHTTTPIENRYDTTSNIETYTILEPLLSVVLHYQNYHILHHLEPTIPFYRYKVKWKEQTKQNKFNVPSLKLKWE